MGVSNKSHLHAWTGSGADVPGGSHRIQPALRIETRSSLARPGPYPSPTRPQPHPGGGPGWCHTNGDSTGVGRTVSWSGNSGTLDKGRRRVDWELPFPHPRRISSSIISDAGPRSNVDRFRLRNLFGPRLVCLGEGRWDLRVSTTVKGRRVLRGQESVEPVSSHLGV